MTGVMPDSTTTHPLQSARRTSRNPLLATALGCALGLAFAPLARAAASIEIDLLSEGAWLHLPDAPSPDQITVDFGSTRCNEPVEKQFRIRNAGDEDLEIVVELDDPDPIDRSPTALIGSLAHAYSFPDFPSGNFTIAPGGTRPFKLRFLPTDERQSASDTLIRVSSAAGNHQFWVQGTASCGHPSVHYDDPAGSDPAIAHNENPSVAKGTSFGLVERGSSATHAFYVHNSGSAPLVLAFPEISGPQMDEFELLGFDPAEIPVGGTLAFQIRFTPTHPGNREAQLRFITDNSTFQPFIVRLRGVGEIPEIDIRGETPSGSYQTIPNGDSTPQAGDSTDFGSVAAGQSVTRRFRIYNTGSGPLSWQAPIIGGDGSEHFTVCDCDFDPVPPITARNFTIDFHPISGGRTETATVTILHDDPNEGPYTFTITGSSSGPEIVVSGDGSSGSFAPISHGSTTPSPLNATDFGTTAVGGSTQHTFRIRNSGNIFLNVPGDQVSLAGAGAEHFNISGIPQGGAIIIPDEFILFTIDHSPSAPGLHQATVSIGSSDADENPFTFSISGQTPAANASDIAVAGFDDAGKEEQIADGDGTPDQAATQFGPVTIGAERARSFRIYNTGNADLTIDSARSSSGDFAIAGLAATIRPGDHDDFTVTFAPSRRGPGQTEIAIASNAPDAESAYSFALGGEGIAAEMQAAISRLAIDHRGSASFSISIPEGRSFLLLYSTDLEGWERVPGLDPIVGSDTPIELVIDHFSTLDGNLPMPEPRLFLGLVESS